LANRWWQQKGIPFGTYHDTFEPCVVACNPPTSWTGQAMKKNSNLSSGSVSAGCNHLQ